MAARGAQGPGRRRPHLRADDLQGRHRLGPLHRHALAGLRRRGRRAGLDQRRRRRDRGRARHLSGRARRHLLLLHLRRPHRGRGEHVARDRAGAVAQVRQGQVRQRLAAAPLGPDPDGPRHRGREALGARQGAVPRHQGRRARPLAADRGRQRRRHRRTTRVDGATIRARLGLYDTWAYFTSIRTGRRPAGGAGRAADAGDPGAAAPARRPTAGARPAGGLRGSVMPARRGAGSRSSAARRPLGHDRHTRAGAGGRYEAAVAAAGTYRVRYRGDAGPAVPSATSRARARDARHTWPAARLPARPQDRRLGVHAHARRRVPGRDARAGRGLRRPLRHAARRGHAWPRPARRALRPAPARARPAHHDHRHARARGAHVVALQAT